MCGRPASGKSKRAGEIKDYLENVLKAGLEVVVINEESLGLDRNVGYSGRPGSPDNIKEKEMRGLFRSHVEKHLTNKNVVILDTLNYIKGVRYELYCLARTAKSTNCVVRSAHQVYCETPVEQAREWNDQKTAGKYHAELFEDLSKRMEEPNSRSCFS